MRTLLLLLHMFVIIVVSARPSRCEERNRSDTEMQKKLTYSRDILDGLVMEDFDKIFRSANALNQLGQRKWIENDSSDYRTQNQVFWFTAKALVMASKNRNLDGATLAYTQMVQSCINCHKVIRRH